MPELTDTQALPVLPLATGVVLPNTVATLTLETDEARAAVAAAGDGGRLLLVPRIDGRYARVGTVAVVEESGELPNGLAAAIIRGLHRATLGAGVAGTGAALWVEAHDVEERPASAQRRGARARAAGRPVGARRAAAVAAAARAAAYDDRAGRARGRVRRMVRHADRAQGRAARGRRHREPRRARARVGARRPGRARGRREDPPGGRRGHGEAAAGVPSAPTAPGHPQGARRGRGRRQHDRGAAGEGGRGRPPGVGRARRHQGDRQAGAHVRAEPGARVDPHMARHDPRAAVGRPLRGATRRGRGPAHPGRGSHRPG